MVSRYYFAGYTLLTLGDYRLEGLVWQVATVMTVGNGFVLVTLAITYLMPLASAVTQMRQLAAPVNALGETSDAILTGAFDGDSLQQLQGDLYGVEQQLLLHQQRHLTYPVLHYFHSSQPGTAAPLQPVILDEALTLLEADVAAEVACPQAEATSPRRPLSRLSCPPMCLLLRNRPRLYPSTPCWPWASLRSTTGVSGPGGRVGAASAPSCRRAGL